MGDDAFGPLFWRAGDIEECNGFPRYSDGEMRRRHEWLDETMSRANLDAVIVGGATGALETSVQYFTNWPAQVPSFAVFAPNEEPFMLVRLWNHVPDAKRIATIEDVRYGGDTPAEQANTLGSVLAKRRVRRAGFIGVIGHSDYDTLRRTAPATEWVDLTEDYAAHRLVKTEEEMVYTRIASRMNDAAVAALAAHLRPGMREYEVAHVIEGAYLAHRGTNLIHFSLTTPMAAPEVNVPHQFHPDREIAPGDVFVTEISTTFWGYAGQILRTFVIGEDATARYARLHAVACEAYDAIVDILEPGATVGDVLDAAELIDTAGFDIWDDLVHGFGGAYLPPIVRTRSSRGATHPDAWAYPEGTLLVVQPNVIDAMAGVQVGNSMWLGKDGVEVTQQYPMELIRCG